MQSVSSSETQVYKCKTDKNKWVYQQEPCAKEQQQQKLDLDTSKKGHQFATQQSILKTTGNHFDKVDPKSPYFHRYENIKSNLEKADANCDDARSDFIKAVDRAKNTCENKHNSYCREAKSASLAGNFDRRTWGPKEGYSAYRDLKDAKDREDRYCRMVENYQTELQTLLKRINEQ